MGSPFGQGVLSQAVSCDRMWVALSGAGDICPSSQRMLQTPLSASQLRCLWTVHSSAFSMLVLREQDPVPAQEYEYLRIQCPHSSSWLSP